MKIHSPELVDHMPQTRDLDLWRATVTDGERAIYVHVEIYGSAHFPDDVTTEDVVISWIGDTWDSLTDAEKSLDGLASLEPLHIAAMHTTPWWEAVFDPNCPHCDHVVPTPTLAGDYASGEFPAGIVQYREICEECRHVLVRDTEPGSIWIDLGEEKSDGTRNG